MDSGVPIPSTTMTWTKRATLQLDTVVVFGDSLCDIGKKWKTKSGKLAISSGDMYVSPTGRFSDCRNWTDFMFEEASGTTMVQGTPEATIKTSVQFTSLKPGNVLLNGPNSFQYANYAEGGACGDTPPGAGPLSWGISNSRSMRSSRTARRCSLTSAIRCSSSGSGRMTSTPPAAGDTDGGRGPSGSGRAASAPGSHPQEPEHTDARNGHDVQVHLRRPVPAADRGQVHKAIAGSRGPDAGPVGRAVHAPSGSPPTEGHLRGPHLPGPPHSEPGDHLRIHPRQDP